MAFVVPQHLPRSTQNVGYGSTTSHAEPVLRKLAEATRESLTSAEAGKWVDELQKSIGETKVRWCIRYFRFGGAQRVTLLDSCAAAYTERLACVRAAPRLCKANKERA